MTLQFHPADHHYTWQGRRVPNVTAILEQLGHFRGVPHSVLEHARRRGSEVHKACAMDDLGELDDTAYLRTERGRMIMGYVEGWRRFSIEHRVRWRWVETPVYHEDLEYAGTPDRIGLVSAIDTTVDIKTGEGAHPIWGLQTAAYNRAQARYYDARETEARITVSLSSDGGYKVHRWDRDASDWNIFQSLLNVHNWKQ